jgi:hypothetical protein
MFNQTPFNGDISGWNVSHVTSLRWTFSDCPILEQHKPVF